MEIKVSLNGLEREKISNLGSIVHRFSKKNNSYRPPIKTPLPSSIKASEALTGRFTNDFSRIITKPTEITTYENLLNLTSQINLAFDNFQGARPASGSVNGANLSKVGHYGRSWYRDLALFADSMFDIGLNKEGTDVLFRIFKFANSPQQREKFYDNFVAIGKPAAWERYRTSDTSIYHPHIVAARNDEGDLSTSNIDWGHAQLDGIALTLWVLFRRANEKKIDLLDFNEKLNALNYSGYPASNSGSKENFNSKESIMVLMLKFLSYTNAAHQSDFGAWEEHRDEKRLSIAAATCAAAIEAKEHFVQAKWDPKSTIKIGEDYSSPQFYRDLNNLIDSGTWVMENRIPTDGVSSAKESDTQGADGSFCWILGLLYKTLPLSMNQQQGLINGVNSLQREWGTIRYEGDPYLGKGYTRTGNEKFMAVKDHEFQEATWPLFDAYMAKYSFLRFAKGGYINDDFLAKGIGHANRVFSQVTVPNEIDHHIHGKATIRGGFLPEANSLDPKTNGVITTAHAEPLIWTEAATMSMLTQYLDALGYEANF